MKKFYKGYIMFLIIVLIAGVGNLIYAIRNTGEVIAWGCVDLCIFSIIIRTLYDFLTINN